MDASHQSALDVALARAARAEADLAVAQVQLRKANLQLETAQHLAHIGSWSLEIATGEVEWSDELFRIFQLDPALDAPSYDVHSGLFEPADFARLQAAVNTSVTTGAGYELTLSIVRRDGTRGTAIARAATLRNDDGNVARLVGTFQDVTEQQRQTQEQLREYGERLELAATVARIGSWEWNATTGEHRWDDAVYQMYGVSKDQALPPLGTFWRAAVHPDDLARVEAHLREALAGTCQLNISFRINTPQGVRYLLSTGAIHRDASGRALRVIGLNKDVTEHRRAQEALAASEALRRAVITHAGSMFIAIDTQGTITLFNRAAEQVLGYRAEEVEGVHTPDLFHDADEIRAYGAELTAAGYEVSTPLEIMTSRCYDGPVVREWTYIARDGRRIPVLLTISELRSEGRSIGFLGVAADLTMRKEQERLLQQRSAQTEVLLQEVHHRVKNNLQVIASLMNMQLRKVTDPGAKHALLECRTRVESIALIHEQLYQSKDYASVPFSDYCGKLVSNVFHTTSNMQDRVALQLNLEPIALPVDQAIPLGLILNELITNALKHAFPDDRRGTVTIGLGQHEQRVVLTVADDGVGGSAPAVTSASLGTLLVRTLVRQLGGTLEVGVDRGMKFAVTFPVGGAT